MGCCSCFASNAHGVLTPTVAAVAFQKPREKEFLYEIIFPSRPFYVTITSASNHIDGYITAVDKLCPVENPEQAIVLNSKVIYVNEILVEGYHIEVIAAFLMNASLPLKLILCKPDGLENNETPEMEPERIIGCLQN
jgi:hypothetical protein